MLNWSRILLLQSTQKPYADFLTWLLEKNFFIEQEKISVKSLALGFKADTTKITKWLHNWKRRLN
jgi:hypothetical protein